MKCLFCENTGWVCENHPDQPWQGRTPAPVAAPVHRTLAATPPPPTSRRACRFGVKHLNYFESACGQTGELSGILMISEIFVVRRYSWCFDEFFSVAP